MDYPVQPNAINLELLESEIKSSGCINIPFAMTLAGDVLTILGLVSDQAALDSVVAAHDPEPLSAYKIKKNLTIDAKTQKLISAGFTFDGHQFSLSPAAQMNWSGLKTFESLLTWPVKVTAGGDAEYQLSQANLIQFVGTAVGTVSAHYTAGRALKLLVNAAANKAEVDAVTDNR